MTNARQRIIVVEDSETQALKLQNILESEGWEVFCAFAVESAMAEIDRRSPDLIIVDYYLPGIRGDELCRRIRMNVNTRSIPILMLTTEGTGADELRGLESGADDYVAKTVDEDVLLLRIRALLRKSNIKPSVLVSKDSLFRRARLLLIDDSRTYLEYIKGELQQEGYRIEATTDAAEGLNRIAKEPFDCVLVDLVMPEIDGIEVCRRVISMQSASESPMGILILTSQETKEDMTRGLEVGADDFVGKSSDLSVLKGRIRALLRRKFYQDENRRIGDELNRKEVEIIRARAEKEIAEAQAAVAGELKKTAEELKRSNEELESFSYSVSHDLRAPLRAIDGYSRILLEEFSDRIDAEGKRLFKVIRSNAQRMAELIDDILSFSRMGRKEMMTGHVDMTALAKEVYQEIQTAHASRRITVKWLPLPSLDGDAAMMRQVLQNLIANAVKFTHTREEAVIEIGAVEEKDENVYFVRDNGVGFDMKYQNKLFGVFQRLHSVEEFEGTGVGLAIVKRVVQRHGGRVWADAKIGEGAAFYFALPRPKNGT